MDERKTDVKPTKKPYAKPRLECFGDIRQLTRSVSSMSKNTDNATKGVSKT